MGSLGHGAFQKRKLGRYMYIYTHTDMDRDFTLEGCEKKGVLGNQVFMDGETGTGALLSRKLSVCVCVAPERKKERGWMDWKLPEATSYV